jgi:hypothetical protein
MMRLLDHLMIASCVFFSFPNGIISRPGLFLYFFVDFSESRDIFLGGKIYLPHLLGILRSGTLLDCLSRQATPERDAPRFTPNNFISSVQLLYPRRGVWPEYMWQNSHF